MTLALAALIWLVEAVPRLYEKKMRGARVGVMSPPTMLALRRCCRLEMLALWWFLAFLLPAPVRAQQVDETTTWALSVAPDSRCARVPAFDAGLRSQVPPGARAELGQAELVIEVRVSQLSPRQLRAQLQVRDTVLDAIAGSRSLDMPVTDCATLAEQLGLVVGVLVESGRAALVPPPPEEEEEEPEEEEEEEPRVVRPTKRNWRGPKLGHDLELGAAAGWGLLPGVTWGYHGAWGIRSSRPWGVRLRLAWWTPRSQNAEPGSAEFWSVYGGLAVCPRIVNWGRFRARACTELAVGAIWGKASGYVLNASEQKTVMFLGAELGGDIRIIGPLYVGVGLNALAPVIRHRFIYYSADGERPEIHQPRFVTLGGVGTVGLRFR